MRESQLPWGVLLTKEPRCTFVDIGRRLLRGKEPVTYSMERVGHMLNLEAAPFHEYHISDMPSNARIVTFSEARSPAISSAGSDRRCAEVVRRMPNLDVYTFNEFQGSYEPSNA